MAVRDRGTLLSLLHSSKTSASPSVSTAPQLRTGEMGGSKRSAGLLQQLQQQGNLQQQQLAVNQQDLDHNKAQAVNSQQQQQAQSQNWMGQKPQLQDVQDIAPQQQQQQQQQNVAVFNQQPAVPQGKGDDAAIPPAGQQAFPKKQLEVAGADKDQTAHQGAPQAERRAQEQREAAQEAAYRQQELLRQQQVERVREQQEAIRKQLEEQKHFQQQQNLQQQQQQQQQQQDSFHNNNNNQQQKVNNDNSLSDVSVHKPDQPGEPPKEAVPTPRPKTAPEQRFQQVPEQQQQQQRDRDTAEQDSQQPVQNVNVNRDVQYENDQRQAENAQGGFRKVPEVAESNLNEVPRERFPSEQQVREVGGMHINWDWDDFSITFEQYGAAEMKVRRAHHATTGEPWPLPQYYTKKEKNIMVVDPEFQFSVTSNISCDVIDQAIERYRNRIRLYSLEDMYDNLQNAEGTYVENPDAKYRSSLYQRAPVISTFSLKIRKPCSVYPSMESDESYDLVVKKSGAYLWANEVWGLLRGLETLSQLVWRGPDDRLYVKESVISDYPRFPHRGILIDSSRHFIFKEVLYDMMDAMEMNKMNVLHWHIVDDQSFPYESQVFPELSAKGAYHPSFVYSLQDIADLLEYARMRGIRIVPEFDSPGHTYSWGLSRPELLTQCYSGSSLVKGYLGPIQPVRNSTYRFLKTLFEEVLHVFKDQFIHLGGDEVPLGCWQSNPEVSKFGEKLSQEEGHAYSDQSLYFGGTSPAMRLVYEYYVNRLMKDIKSLGEKRNGVKFIMWQEVMNNDLKLPNDTLIQVWMGDMADVSKAIGKGYNVLYSSCWYLDHVEYGVKWPKYYSCDPADASYGYSIDEKKVKGGEACLWSEYIDNENLVQTTWPRASAVAERLWSSKDTRNLDQAGERLSEHRCRMLRRGLSVGQVSGPDYCLKRGPRRTNRGESGCQGDACKSERQPDLEENSDIQFRVRSQGRASPECTWMFQVGGNVTLLALVAVVAFVVLVSVSHSTGRLKPLRACRQRTLLLVFVAVVLVYFMCYTTMWMHVFEFSGSFRKKRPAAGPPSLSAS
ncbi:uncharacterized protein LOC143300402 isoform X2 [Babylonia areolata]|uniref:uncharacterized protein LOC143300402 isoform X2 n=1 Tax=Babylonia areolata TaxID=304850 RepID=UPI003FD4F6E5